MRPRRGEPPRSSDDESLDGATVTVRAGRLRAARAAQKFTSGSAAGQQTSPAASRASIHGVRGGFDSHVDASSRAFEMSRRSAANDDKNARSTSARATSIGEASRRERADAQIDAAPPANVAELHLRTRSGAEPRRAVEPQFDGGSATHGTTEHSTMPAPGQGRPVRKSRVALGDCAVRSLDVCSALQRGCDSNERRLLRRPPNRLKAPSCPVRRIKTATAIRDIALQNRIASPALMNAPKHERNRRCGNRERCNSAAQPMDQSPTRQAAFPAAGLRTFRPDRRRF